MYRSKAVALRDRDRQKACTGEIYLLSLWTVDLLAAAVAQDFKVEEEVDWTLEITSKS